MTETDTHIGEAASHDVSNRKTFSNTTEVSGLPVQDPCGNEVTTWYHSVVSAIKNRSLATLTELLDDPVTNRDAVVDHAEDIIEAVANAITSRAIPSNFRSTLETLMRIVVEYGNPQELVMFLSNIFHKDGAEVEFFIPSMQSALLRLQKFRLFWLSSSLTQIDKYVSDMKRSNTDEDDNLTSQYKWIVRMHALVCDFVEPFVEDVKTSRASARIPKEKNCSQEHAVLKYRECLARSLLRLLAEPLGSMRVSDVKKLPVTYQRIVSLLGNLVPDFNVIIKWMKHDHDREDGENNPAFCDENTNELMKSAVSVDSIARLAFFVRCCNATPNNFPASLSPTYFLKKVVLPYPERIRHLFFMTALLNDVPDGLLSNEDVPISTAVQTGNDLLAQAYGESDAKLRKQIYDVVQLFFTKLDLCGLHLSVRELWQKEEIKKLATVLEVLVVVLKKSVVEQLKLWPTQHFDRHQFLDIFKTLLRTRTFDSVADCSGLIAAVLGLLAMVVGMDWENRTGIIDLLDAVEDYHHFWTNKLEEDTRQMREERWLKTQEENGSVSAGKDSELGVAPTKEQTVELADQCLNWTNILSLNLESLQRQIGLARDRNTCGG